MEAATIISVRSDCSTQGSHSACGSTPLNSFVCTVHKHTTGARVVYSKNGYELGMHRMGGYFLTPLKHVPNVILELEIRCQ